MSENDSMYAISKNRYLDINGFLYIKDQAVMRAGVFEYARREVADLIAPDDESEVVKVFRPPDELQKVTDYFVNKPVTREHAWVDIESKNSSIVGSIGSGLSYDAAAGEVKADLITIHEEKAIYDILAGLRDKLSAGFNHKLIREPGVYEGLPFDYKQVIIGVNHLALCETPRDEDLRIHDSKPKANLKEKVKMGYNRLFNKLGLKKSKSGARGKDSEEEASSVDNAKNALEALGLEKKHEEALAEVLELVTKAKAAEDEEAEAVAKDEEEVKAEDQEGEEKTGDSVENEEELLKTLASLKESLDSLVARVDKLENGTPEATDSTEEKEEEKAATDSEEESTEEKLVEELKEELKEEIKEEILEEEEAIAEAYDAVSKAIGDFTPRNKNGKRKTCDEIYAYGLSRLASRYGVKLGRVKDSKSAFLTCKAMASRLDSHAPVKHAKIDSGLKIPGIIQKERI